MQSFYSLIPKDGHLTASMDAVALAYLNYQRHTPNVQTEARQHYITALRLMSKALQDPELARKNSSLLAILLLDLYEKVTNKEPHYEGAWAAHLQGALALVKMRGDEQFNDPMVVRILLRVSTNQIISCIATHRPVPEDVVALRHAIAGRISSPSQLKLKESDLMIEYARLRYKIENAGLSDKEAILSLQELDERFEILSMNVRSTWQFKDVQVLEKSIHHWESYHHVYPSESIAQVWNVIRVTRILLNELLLDRSFNFEEDEYSKPKTLSIRQHALDVIVRMVSDICASIPQYIGDSPLGDTRRTVTPGVIQSASKKQQRSPAPARTTTSNPTYYLPCYSSYSRSTSQRYHLQLHRI